MFREKKPSERNGKKKKESVDLTQLAMETVSTARKGEK